MIKTIYLDMDGVIADFDKGYSAKYGVYCRDDPVKDHWREAVADGLFERLEFTPGAEKLLEFLDSLGTEVQMLSCIGNRNDSHMVAAQKLRWLASKNILYKPNFTYTKVEKSDFAWYDTLLIDDSKACIDPFVEKRGVGILHTSVDNTIEQLKVLIEKGILCAPSLDTVT